MDAALSREKLVENSQINDLVVFLQMNQRTVDAENVIAMADYVDRMEEMLNIVTRELSDIKVQMNQMQKPTPLGKQLADANEQLRTQFKDMKQELLAIKTEIKKTAQSIVTDVKQRSSEGLDCMVKFLGVRRKLETFKENAERSLVKVEGTIAKIDAFGNGMRDAGRQMANTMRIFMGKSEKEYGEKKFSKTELAKKPFQEQKKLLEKLLEFTERAIDKCEKLSQSVQGQREKKSENLEKPTGKEQSEDLLGKSENPVRDAGEIAEISAHVRKGKRR